MTYPVHETPTAGLYRVEVQTPVDSQTLHQTVDGLFTDRGDVKGVILDLASIDFIESSGLGALVAVYKRCGDKQCPVVFLNPQAYVVKLIEITRLDKVLTIKHDLNEAVAACS